MRLDKMASWNAIRRLAATYSNPRIIALSTTVLALLLISAWALFVARPPQTHIYVAIQAKNSSTVELFQTYDNSSGECGAAAKGLGQLMLKQCPLCRLLE